MSGRGRGMEPAREAGAGCGPESRGGREGQGRESRARRCPVIGGSGGRAGGSTCVLAAPALRPRPDPRPAMPPPAPPTELVPSERAVVLLSCVLSALGSGLLVATHALWPDLRSRARRLLLFLSLADLLSAASYFYGVLQDFTGPSWDCVLQGALSTFANTSSFFWTVAIALYLYLSIVRATRGPRAGHLLWTFHVVRWVAAELLSFDSPALPQPQLPPGPCLLFPWPLCLSGAHFLVRPMAGRPGGQCLLMPQGSPEPAGRCQACPRGGPVLGITAEDAPLRSPWAGASARWEPQLRPVEGGGPELTLSS